MSDLVQKHCQACEGGSRPMDAGQVSQYLGQLDGWQVEGDAIRRTFKFKNHYETMAFVNALAWISHRENHHPDLEVGYNACTVTYTTHAVGGLSENDFICAAKVDSLLRL